MSKALLSPPSSGVIRTAPLALAEIQQNVEDHEGRLDALDAGTQLAASVSGTAVAGAAAILGASKEISGLMLSTVARTATAAGLTTGTIADGAGQLQIIVVTCDDANKIIILPTPVVGTIIVIINGTTGYELRSSSPTTIGINGGVAADGESAIPASTTAILVCETLTNWKGFQMSSTAGTLAKVEVAA